MMIKCPKCGFRIEYKKKNQIVVDASYEEIKEGRTESENEKT